MQDLFLRLRAAARLARGLNNGQSMTEYAMTVSLIAFGCISGEAAVATSVNQVFVTMGAIISNGVLR